MARKAQAADRLALDGGTLGTVTNWLIVCNRIAATPDGHDLLSNLFRLALKKPDRFDALAERWVDAIERELEDADAPVAEVLTLAAPRAVPPRS